MSARRSSLSRVTRRRWAASVVALPLVAQVTTTTPPLGSPATAKAPAGPEERLAKAYADVRQVSDRLAKIEVPMSVEPAFSFRP